MAKTRINVKNVFDDSKKSRRIGILDTETNLVKTSNGEVKPLSFYESIDPNGVGFFETRKNKKIISKIGKWLNLN